MSNYGTTYQVNQQGDLYTLEDHGTPAGQAKYAGAKGTAVNSPMNLSLIHI